MFEEIIKLVTDNGIAIACFVVMIFDHVRTQGQLVEAMNKMTETLTSIDVRIQGLEDRQ